MVVFGGLIRLNVPAFTLQNSPFKFQRMLYDILNFIYTLYVSEHTTTNFIAIVE